MLRINGEAHRGEDINLRDGPLLGTVLTASITAAYCDLKCDSDCLQRIDGESTESFLQN